MESQSVQVQELGWQDGSWGTCNLSPILGSGVGGMHHSARHSWLDVWASLVGFTDRRQ